MKPLHFLEIQALCLRFQALMDSKLNNIHVYSSGYVFECYKNSKVFYWLIDLSQTLPYTDFFEKSPVSLEKKSKPVSLFLKAHGLGKRIFKIEIDDQVGRGLKIQIGYEKPLILFVRLYPHGVNLIASFEDKKISEFRIKEIPPAVSNPLSEELRSVDTLRLHWLEHRVPRTQKKDLSGESLLISKNTVELILDKKKKTLLKLKQTSQKMDVDLWFSAGLWLKECGFYEGTCSFKEFLKINCPSKFEKCFDVSKNFSQNLDLVFLKAKDIVLKNEGLKNRISILENEILELEKLEQRQENNQENSKKNNLENGEADKDKNLSSGRKGFSWGNGFELFVGKDASENLSQLRSAKPWHLWIHLKDYPGAHGILQFPKQLTPKLSDIEIASQRVAERSKKSLHQIRAGDVFDVLVCEKRFVKPIKGDVIGRVRYSNEKVYSFKKN